MLWMTRDQPVRSLAFNDQRSPWIICSLCLICSGASDKTPGSSSCLQWQLFPLGFQITSTWLRKQPLVFLHSDYVHLLKSQLEKGTHSESWVVFIKTCWVLSQYLEVWSINLGSALSRWNAEVCWLKNSSPKATSPYWLKNSINMHGLSSYCIKYCFWAILHSLIICLVVKNTN